MGESVKKSNYKEWINSFYQNKEACINQCNTAVRKIIKQFPELKIQVGYANGRYHCWTINNYGDIIDPTSKQFDSKIEYTLIAGRFLKKDEIELSTGAIFLKEVSRG